MAKSGENEKTAASGTGAARKPGLGFPRGRKLWLMASVVLMLVVAAAVGTWLLHRTKKAPVRVTTSQLNSIQSQAEATAHGQGSAAGLNVYKQAIANATDQKTRGELELYAASQALNNHMVDTALNYALQADAILHSADSSSYVADIYKQKGDDADAIKYYKLAAQEVNPRRLAGDGPEFYLNEAQALSGGAQP